MYVSCVVSYVVPKPLAIYYCLHLLSDPKSLVEVRVETTSRYHIWGGTGRKLNLILLCCCGLSKSTDNVARVSVGRSSLVVVAVE